MKKRLWLRLTILIVVVLIGTAIWIKKTVDEQPTEHEDPGAPDVPDLPDPEDVE